MVAHLTIYRDRVRMYAAREGSIKDRIEIAEKIAADARALAPVVTGDYRNHIDTRQADGFRVYVVDDDDTAIHKEYGTSDTPAHAALTTAAMKYGRYRGMRPRKGRMQ